MIVIEHALELPLLKQLSSMPQWATQSKNAFRIQAKRFAMCPYCGAPPTFDCVAGAIHQTRVTMLHKLVEWIHK